MVWYSLIKNIAISLAVRLLLFCGCANFGTKRAKIPFPPTLPVCHFVGARTSNCAYVARSWLSCPQGKNKLIRSQRL